MCYNGQDLNRKWRLYVNLAEVDPFFYADIHVETGFDIFNQRLELFLQPRYLVLNDKV